MKNRKIRFVLGMLVIILVVFVSIIYHLKINDKKYYNSQYLELSQDLSTLQGNYVRKIYQ